MEFCEISNVRLRRQMSFPKRKNMWQLDYPWISCQFSFDIEKDAILVKEKKRNWETRKVRDSLLWFTKYQFFITSWHPLRTWWISEYRFIIAFAINVTHNQPVHLIPECNISYIKEKYCCKNWIKNENNFEKFNLARDKEVEKFFQYLES